MAKQSYLMPTIRKYLKLVSQKYKIDKVILFMKLDAVERQFEFRRLRPSVRASPIHQIAELLEVQALMQFPLKFYFPYVLS